MRAFWLVAGWMLALLPLGGQQPPPVFKAAVDVITVDVRVLDRAGRPVPGLASDEFTVTVEGGARKIVGATYVSYSGRAAAPSVGPRPARPEPLVSTNVLPDAPAPGRQILLVLDEANIHVGAGRFAAAAATRFLDNLAPTDRVGIVTIPHASIAVDPTTDRARVRQALDRVTGRLLSPQTQQSSQLLGLAEAFTFPNDKDGWSAIVQRKCGEGSRECRAELEHDAASTVADVRQRMRESVRAFAGLVDGLASLPGPKTLVLVSEELPVSSYLEERRAFSSEAERIMDAAARAEVTTYVLHLQGPAIDVETRTAPADDTDMGAFGLEMIASLTGGRRMMVSGSPDAAFDTITRELSGYYLLGIQPEPTDRDGKPHEMRVAVKRKGVEVRARRAFAFLGAVRTTESVTARDVVTRMLRAPEPATAIPITLATYVVGNQGNSQVKLMIAAEVTRGSSDAQGITVGYSLVDDSGKNAGASVEEGVLQAVPNHPERPLRYNAAAVVPAGHYTVRFAAVDTALAAGSVEHTVNATLGEAGGLALSELVLLDEFRTEADRPSLSAPATVDEIVSAYLEAYPTASLPSDFSAVLEVAEAGDAPSIASTAMSVDTEQGRVRMSGSVPIRNLSPGGYLARAVLRSGAQSIGQVARPFHVVAHAAVVEVGAPPAGVPPPEAAASASVSVPSAPPVPPAPAKAAPPSSAATTVADLMERAGTYVVEYGEQMSVIVATERYAQWMENDDMIRPVSRQLVSEFALLRVKDDWLGYRDVYEVDGGKVGDRQDRLQQLIRQSPSAAIEQGRRIADESARFNMGAVQRNFNVPTMALFFLHPSNQKRFKFSKRDEDTVNGIRVWRVRCEESQKPTIIRTSQGRDMPVSGSFWIDPVEGRVLKTHMEITSEVRRDVDDMRRSDLALRRPTSASITVSYQLEPRLNMLVPAEMLETYEGPSVSRFTGKEAFSKINCRATYSQFKRFETSGRVLTPK